MRYSSRYRVRPGSKVRLARWKTDDTAGVKGKKQAQARTERNLRRLSELEYLLYAESKRALLIVLQAMDAGGKDGTIRHVMGPMNPQSCRVTSFKAPTAEELEHDFLWRVHRAVPRAGEIGIFNRSHYEDVLIARVRKLVPKRVWSRRYRHINDFERLLTDSGVHLLKFFLHISPGEQLRRFRARLADPTKHWKANPQDFEERKLWDAYMKAYEDALGKCSTARAPWYVIPADRKWFRNLAVSEIMVEALEALDMKFPEPAFDVSTLKVE